MRSKKILLNSSIGLIREAVNMICGFLLPWLIISNFGSNYNGLTASILQFLNTIVLLKAGIAAVTRAALYKPLAENNITKISEILYATMLFMKKIALIFAACLICFAFVYPFIIDGEFGWLFTFSLVLIMGASTVVQNYLGITYQMLLLADQRNYIYSIIQIITIILSTIVTIIIINLGGSIHIVQLGITAVYTLNPILLILYVHKHYHIIKNVTPDPSAISQRWSAFTQEIAVFVNNNTDLVILTIFSTVWQISVYTVYYLVVNGIRTLILTLSGGIGAALGNMIANKEDKALSENFRIYEFFLFTAATIAFTCTALLIVPFVMVYTKGVNDVNYYRPLFGYMVSASMFFYCIRIPYDDLVEAVGHFKETRNGAIFESLMNITISIIFVQKLGLIGVTIGTLCAMVFRTFQYALYSSKHILNRSIRVVIKRLLSCIAEVATIVFLVSLIPSFEISNYFMWGWRAIEVFIIATVVVFFYKFIFFKSDLLLFIRKITIAVRRI
ncbi:TPA: polysaccharide biosynthesis C-terminal domain-containing protein [Bacillus anthracis]|uniref:lipopolysaccharide biosynthesis protein n=1 Tax=Bacillus cereus TaxID=1396 RepID=UPI000994C93A|nr:polysaccharide biosynthesis C-terminal domain-containing protein [Bacillus cereus]OOZ89166.1 sugar isomerase [Bacillus cereus]HDR7334336.1 polysaccharide biosynthesis C-terminal domain-containing protein [Bacillus anthracis]